MIHGKKVNNAPVDLGQVTSIDSPYVFDRYKLMPGTYRIIRSMEQQRMNIFI